MNPEAKVGRRQSGGTWPKRRITSLDRSSQPLVGYLRHDVRVLRYDQRLHEPMHCCLLDVAKFLCSEKLLRYLAPSASMHPCCWSHQNQELQPAVSRQLCQQACVQEHSCWSTASHCGETVKDLYYCRDCIDTALIADYVQQALSTLFIERLACFI
jgi:hypothetical protein